jgi:hypothetical protein
MSRRVPDVTLRLLRGEAMLDVNRIRCIRAYGVSQFFAKKRKIKLTRERSSSVLWRYFRLRTLGFGFFWFA